MHRRNLIAFLASSSIAWERASAEIVEYENDAEYGGAIVSVPWVAAGTLAKLSAFCKGAYPDQSPRFEAEFQKWRARHSGYLALSKQFRSVFVEIIQDPKTKSADRDGLKNLLEVMVPQAIDRTADAYIAPVNGAKSLGRDKELMSALIDALANRKFDLFQQHPQLVSYMDKLLAGKPSSGPTR